MIRSVGRALLPNACQPETHTDIRAVEQNIGYGREGSTDEEIGEAAKAARLDDRIMGFPEGKLD